jgi:hypothetical protein
MIEVADLVELLSRVQAGVVDAEAAFGIPSTLRYATQLAAAENPNSGAGSPA